MMMLRPSMCAMSTSIAPKAYRLSDVMILRASMRAMSTPREKAYVLIGTGSSSQCKVYSRSGWNITTDIPSKVPLEPVIPQPVELLLAGLIGCEQATAMFVARHIPMTIHRINFNLKAVRDEKGALTLPLGTDHAMMPPSRLSSITGTAHVYTDASQQKVDLLEAEVNRRCPIANMVTLSGCELDIRWIKKNEDE
jgi:putative redox protein